MPSQRDNRGRYLPRDSAGSPGKGSSGGSSPTKVSPVAGPAVDWAKKLKEGAKAAGGMEHSLTSLQARMQSAGVMGQVSQSHMAELVKGMKLGGKGASFLEAETVALQKAQADQLATQGKSSGATAQAGMGMSAQIEILKMVAGAAWVATKALAQVGVSFATATLGAVDFRQGTITAIDMLTKKKGEGSRAFEIGIELAARFHTDPQQTLASLHGLISKGFSADRAKIIIEAMADLKVLSPKANLDKVSLAIEQIKGKGKLQMEELQGQLAEAGLSVSLVLEQLAAKYGKSTDEVRKMISKGKVDAEDGVDAIVAAIKKMGTGKLGAAAENAARGTVGGLVEGIKMRLAIVPLEMAKSLASGAGVGAVKGALGNLLDALNPTKTPEMKALIAEVGAFANTLFAVLFGGAAGAGAGKAMSKLLAGLGSTIKVISAVVGTVGPVVMEFFAGLGGAFSETFSVLSEIGAGLVEAFGGDKSSMMKEIGLMARSVGKVMGYLAVAVGLVVVAVVSMMGVATAMAATIQAAFWLAVAAVDRVVGAFQDMQAQLSGAGLSAGNNLGQGLVDGILNKLATVSDAGSQLANAAKSSVQTSLKINSPSRVMAEMGGHTAAGFAEGVDSGQGQVDASMNALVAPKPSAGAPAAGGQAGAAAGGAFSFTVGDIHIHVGAGTNPSAQEIGKSVKQELRDLLEDLLGQAGLSPTPSPA